jgi:hypothetical protein
MSPVPERGPGLQNQGNTKQIQNEYKLQKCRNRENAKPIQSKRELHNPARFVRRIIVWVLYLFCNSALL